MLLHSTIIGTTATSRGSVAGHLNIYSHDLEGSRVRKSVVRAIRLNIVSAGAATTMARLVNEDSIEMAAMGGDAGVGHSNDVGS